MRYEWMFPKELDAAKAEKRPLLLPIGTIEYHGPHCAYGCDGLIAEGIAKCLEASIGAVLMPTFWFGCSSYAVGGPEKGTVDVQFEPLKDTLQNMLYSLLEGGFRNIVLLIHHQYEQESMMPTTLAAASAAKTATMAFLENTRGRGWWGDNQSANYYAALDEADNPFNWIRVMPAMSAQVQAATGYDHAGKFECSLLMALCPEAVRLERLSESDEWFIQSAKDASAEYGREMLALSVKALEERIGK